MNKTRRKNSINKGVQAAGIVLSLLTTCLPADKPADAGFRIKGSSRMILVDVVVTGPDRRFIANLKPGEIEIYEDGKKQEPVVFRLESAVGLPVDNPPAGDASAPATPSRIITPDPTRLAAPPGNVSLVFVLDLLTISSDSMPRVVESIRRFLDAPLPVGSRVMLAVIDDRLEVRQPFTGDLPRFGDAVGSIRPRPDVSVDSFSIARFIEDVETIFASHEPTFTFEQAADESTRTAGVYLASLSNRIHTVAEALGALSRHLASLPGRKHVLFYSAGYPTTAPGLVQGIVADRYNAVMGNARSPRTGRMSFDSLAGSTTLELQQQLQSIVDQANRSLVSIYSIDTRGMVVASGSGEAQNRMPGLLVKRHFYSQYAPAELRATQEFLSSLAEDTGGFCFKNNNDLQQGAQAVRDDALQYYLVGYVPPEGRKSGQFHEIRVKVQRPDTAVRARKGYLELEEARLAGRDVVNAFRFPGLFQDSSLRIEVERTGSKAKVTVFVPTRDLVFRREEDACVCPVDFWGVLLDSAGQQVSDSFLFRNGSILRFRPERLDDFFSNASISRTFAVEIPRGEYELAVVVRMGAWPRLAAARQKVSMPGKP